MARSLSSPILAQLRSAKGYPEQTAALKALKNEIIGHIHKKDAWIAQGILEPITNALSSTRFPAKTNGKDARLSLVSRPLSEEEGVKLQALQLVASFANGGPSFLLPLCNARIIDIVLEYISPYANPAEIVAAALKALTEIVDASIHAGPDSPLTTQTIADNLFAPQHLSSLNAMLSVSSPQYQLQNQVHLAAGLICKLCREDRHQQTLAANGVLDFLAARLASFAVADGVVIPGADVIAQRDGLHRVFPEPASTTARLGLILDAIGAVLGDSKYRAHRLINSPVILAVFPPIPSSATKEYIDSDYGLEVPGSDDGHLRNQTAMDFLLPRPALNSRGSSVSPATFLATDRIDRQSSTHERPRGFANWSGGARTPASQPADGTTDAMDSPLLPWLIHLVRTKTGYDRLMAAYVLTALYKAGLGKKPNRETSIGLLVVPVLVDMIAKSFKEENDPKDSKGATALQQAVLERAPLILARLITGSDFLQKAAFDADAVKIIQKLLKKAYEPTPSCPQARYWSPHPDTGMEVENSSPMAQMGAPGESPLLQHKIRVRESALKAIGALASGKEDYRTAIANDDFIPYIVESINEYPNKPKPPKERPKDQESELPRPGPTPGYGTNPVSVLIAGCYVVRMLSRSVTILRTSLVDHAVAIPIFNFLSHPDVKVQIAATESMINLLLEFSPVRELLTEKGAMRILCEHAHSENPILRMDAIWALKHLVEVVSVDLKKSCLEQLGPQWLEGLICEDTQTNALYSKPRGRSGDDLDEDMEPETADDPPKWLYGNNGSLQELDVSKSTRLRQAENRLAAVRDMELDPARRARVEDTAIQEQGLRFLQNLIGKPTSGSASESPLETAELIDHLFDVIGQDRLFEILRSKLQTKVLHPFARREGRDSKVIYPQTKLIVATIFVLIHLAASVPRHQQLVVAQTDLMKLLVQQMSNPDRDVRVALCHLIINLTWPETDDREMQSWSQRAQELRKLGFHTKMETLKHQDRDLDVRERAKTAFWQMDKVTC